MNSAVVAAHHGVLANAGGGEVLSGLVGWWGYSTSGAVAPLGTVVDGSGQGNAGTLFGDAFVDANGINFGFGVPYVNCGNGLTTLGAGAMTLAAWVYRFPSGAVRSILGKGPDAIVEFALYVSPSDVPAYQADDNADRVTVTADAAITENAWHHVAVIKRSGDTTIMYIDGSIQSNTGAAQGDCSNTGNLLIGNSRLAGTWYGYIGDVRIYNRALSQPEIAQIVALNKR